MVTGGTLNLFNRWAHWITMGNIAQTVNVLQAVIQTQEERFWLTPTYHAFKLFSAHMGNTLVYDELDSPTIAVARPGGASGALALVSTSASVSPDRRRLVLTLVNRHIDTPVECAIQVKGDFRLRGWEVSTLGGTDVREYNSAEEPELVQPEPGTISGRERELRIELPPHSVSTVTVGLTS